MAAQFYVTAEAAPGVARAGVGFFVPGQVLELPDGASRPGDKVSMRLQPVNIEAYDMLVAQHSKDVVAAKYGPRETFDGAKAIAPTKSDPTKTVKQVALEHGSETAKGKRASDA